MTQTPDELRSATLDKRAAGLDALAKQLEHNGAHFYDEANAKCEAKLQEIARREAALAPKEAVLRERTAALDERDRAVTARQGQCRVTEAVQRQTAQDQTAAETDLRARTLALTAREMAHQQAQAADLAVVEQKRAVLTQDLDVREARLEQTRQTLAAQRTQQDRREAQIVQDREKADALLTIARTRDQQSLDAAERSLASQQAAAQALDARQDQLTGRSATLEQDRDTTAQQAAAQAQEGARLEALAKGLNKAKLDLATWEQRLQKRERLVNALIENKGLTAELATLE